MRIFAVAALSVAVLCLTSSSLPGQVPGQPACDGVLVAIRISDIRPDSSMDRFLAAIEAQKNWYASHGYKDDRIFVSQILVRTLDTKNFTAGGKQVMAYHYYSQASAKGAPHDAAWDAFVKMFADSSVIKESILNCVPRDMGPGGRR